MNDFWFTKIGSLTRLVYDCKDQIIKAVNDGAKIKPEYVFCHSGEQGEYSKRYPGYYFVYSNDEDLRKSQFEEQENIINFCSTILSNNDKRGFFHPGRIEFEFLEKNKADLFGLSRED